MTFIIPIYVFKIPEGTIDISHWKSVVEAESKFKIKVCQKLTEDHVRPRHF